MFINRVVRGWKFLIAAVGAVVVFCFSALALAGCSAKGCSINSNTVFEAMVATGFPGQIMMFIFLIIVPVALTIAFSFGGWRNYRGVLKMGVEKSAAIWCFLAPVLSHACLYVAMATVILLVPASTVMGIFESDDVILSFVAVTIICEFIIVFFLARYFAGFIEFVGQLATVLVSDYRSRRQKA